MPEIENMYPEGIIVVARFRLEELVKLKKACEMCEVNADLSDPEEAEVNRYFVEDFYLWVKDTVKEISNGA